MNMKVILVLFAISMVSLSRNPLEGCVEGTYLAGGGFACRKCLNSSLSEGKCEPAPLATFIPHCALNTIERDLQYNAYRSSCTRCDVGYTSILFSNDPNGTTEFYHYHHCIPQRGYDKNCLNYFNQECTLCKSNLKPEGSKCVQEDQIMNCSLRSNYPGNCTGYTEPYIKRNGKVQLKRDNEEEGLMEYPSGNTKLCNFDFGYVLDPNSTKCVKFSN